VDNLADLMKPALKIAAILWLGFLLLAPAGLARAPTALEDLPYRIGLGPWEDAGRFNLTLKELEPGRYQAEFSGGAKGVWSLLKRWLPERYRTEMIFQDGRLKPLVYWEELQIDGKKVMKEYRFDYQKGQLECWRQAENQKKGREWKVPLKEPVYDPLSLFYNIRLGTFGPLASGETLKVQGIPNPDPEEMIISLGPKTSQGRKVMLVIRDKSGRDQGPYFLYLGPEGVPRTAWVRVLRFGKLSGELLDSGGIMKPDRLRLDQPQVVGANH
jgi:hypothetical protein